MTTPSWYSQWLAAAAAVADRQVFFVLGCQKSGTTWLQRLLDAHPQVCCGWEGHFTDLLALRIQEGVNAYNARQAQRIGGEAMLFRRDDLRATLRMLGDQILTRHLRNAPQPERIRAVGDKTPEYSTAIPILEQIYPGAKYLHIIRDGRDACVSGWFHLHRLGHATRFNSLSEYAEFFARQHWVPYIMAARAAASSAPGRYLELRYESLHHDTAGQTRRIVEFLGVDESDEPIQSCVQAASFETLTGGRSQGAEDRSSFFRKGVVGDWRHHLDDDAVRRFEQSAGDLLRALDYHDVGCEVPGATAAG